VPWTPYAVTFSRDGTRLAIGGGVFYGNGGIVIADLTSDRTELFRCDSLPHAAGDWVPAVSGLCFSDDDRYLAASSWSGRHHYAPTMLFEVSGLKVTLRSTLEKAILDFEACPTGVLLSGGFAITRHHGAEPADILVIDEWPHELEITPGISKPYLTSSHLAVVQDSAITAGPGLRLDWNVTGLQRIQAEVAFRESGDPVEEGLVAVALQDEVRVPQLIPVKGCREITAIAATPDGLGFLTGGLEGELDRWSWRGRWQQERLREWTSDSPSVRGICYISNQRDWVAVSSTGRLDLLAENTPVTYWQLPSPGSPRALASHPSEKWIAIGMKQSGWTAPRGVVDLIEIETSV